MPEIEFTIDPSTGELTSRIHGIHGPSCTDVSKIIQSLTGAPEVDEKTPEFYQSVRPTQQVRR